MKLKNVIITLALATFFIISCSSSDDETPAATQSKTEILTTGSWIATDFLINDTSVYDLLIDDCTKDDFQTFKADGTSITDEGATKCDPNDPQTYPGTWKFINNETQIVLDSDDTATIKTLTASELILTSDDFGAKIEARFKKK